MFLGIGLFLLSFFLFEGSIGYLGFFIIALSFLSQLGTKPLVEMAALVSVLDYIIETVVMYAGEITYTTQPFVRGLPPYVFISMGFLAICFGGVAIVLNETYLQNR